MERPMAQQAEMEAAAEPAFEVVVVGLGPVGTTLCSLLAHAGIRVLGIDTAEQVYALPRAIGMDQEVMRVFQEIGLAEDLLADTGVYHASEYRARDGRLLRRLESPPQPWPLAWPPYMTFVQPRLEARLRDKAVALGATLRPGTELVALETPESPRLTLRDNRTGATEVLNVRYVIGCDGGNSFVRRATGLSFEDLVFDEPWLVVDMLLSGPVADLPSTNVQYCNPARPHTFVIGPGNLRRWEFMIMPGDDPAALNSEAGIWRLIAPWLRPNQARIWRSAAYRFHALVAQGWRRGGVLLAGDAAHMTPPFLAQGMVQGIKDSANLAWKLAGVLRQGWPDAVLDSYEAERRPLVREVITVTKGLGRIICEQDPIAAAARDEAMVAEVAADPRPRIRQDLFPPIGDGIVARGSDGLVLAGSGCPCPQPILRTAAGVLRLDDVLGGGFHLLMEEGFKLPETLRETAAALGVGIHRLGLDLEEQDGLLSGWLQRYGAAAVLIRPDRVVFGHAASAVGLRGLLDQLRHWLAPS
jgi:3-(3-hydroxy-phenyl)propionate hydroxylase